MKAMRLRQPASIENLQLEDIEACDPGPGEIKVRVRASSLNFRDGLAVGGIFPARDGLIPLSDAAGEVLEVGAVVTEFAAGDRVVRSHAEAAATAHIIEASTPKLICVANNVARLKCHSLRPTTLRSPLLGRGLGLFCV